MKSSRCTAEQVAFGPRRADEGSPVSKICRKSGLSEQALCQPVAVSPVCPDHLQPWKPVQQPGQDLLRAIPALEVGGVHYRTSAIIHSVTPARPLDLQDRVANPAHSGTGAVQYG